MKSLKPFNSFPREVLAKRKVVHDMKEFIDTINTYNGKTDVFTSVYAFKNLQENGKPDWSSIQIDKVFFDLDGDSAFADMVKLHNWACNKDIRHTINFSGGGYHVYLWVAYKHLKNPSGCLYNFCDWLSKELDITPDRKIFGDIKRITRVPNTWNCKPERQCWCIPITDEHFKGATSSVKQRLNDYQEWGTKKADIQRFDMKANPISEFDDTTYDVENGHNRDIDNAPPCIQAMLKMPDLSWRGRFLLISWLRDNGFLISETIEILRKTLSHEPYYSSRRGRFYHCVYEEKQPFFVYKDIDRIFPSCETINRDGFCPTNGVGCEK